MPQKLKILSVDDEPGMREAIRHCLMETEDMGVEVELLEAENGKQGLLVLEQNQDIAMMFLDVMMPVMDGPTTLKELRSRNNQIPVTLLTAETKISLIGGMLQNGITDYILKPFRPEDLREKVRKIAGQAPVARPQRDLLLVDRIENVAKRLRGLIPENVTLDHAADETKAMKLCREHLYRVVVFDAEIATKENKSFVQHVRLVQPKVAMFALVLKRQDKPVELSADGFLEKPFNAEDIAAFVEKHFGGKPLCEAAENVITFDDSIKDVRKLERQFGQLVKGMEANIDTIANACFESVVLDLGVASDSPKLVKMVLQALNRSQELGLPLQVKAPERMCTHWKKTYTELAEVEFIPQNGAAHAVQPASSANKPGNQET